jgi:hypothetical protein
MSSIARETIGLVNAYEITSVRLPRRRREITVTAGSSVAAGEVRQGHKVVPLVWDNGVGTAVVHPGPCDVVLQYEGGARHVEHLRRHKRAWPKLGHRTPTMPRRYAEYR